MPTAPRRVIHRPLSEGRFRHVKDAEQSAPARKRRRAESTIVPAAVRHCHCQRPLLRHRHRLLLRLQVADHEGGYDAVADRAARGAFAGCDLVPEEGVV
jgi:hypothetical protein